MMVKSGLEEFILKSLHVERQLSLNSRIMYRTEAPRRCIIHIRTFRKPFTKFTNLILVPCLVLWEIHNKHYTLCIKSHLGEHYA